jgi:hypothetical protein
MGLHGLAQEYFYLSQYILQKQEIYPIHNLYHTTVSEKPAASIFMAKKGDVKIGAAGSSLISDHMASRPTIL